MNGRARTVTITCAPRPRRGGSPLAPAGRWCPARAAAGSPFFGLVLAAAAALVIGCSPRPQPASPPARPPAPTEPAAGQVEAKPPPTLVVIDPGGGGDETPSLAEAARAERERRKQETRPPLAVITDKNLAEYAEKGKLTVAEPDPVPAAADTGAGPGAEGEPAVRDEAYWRDRARDVRVRWRQAADEVKALETEAADLRWQFYAEDDPYVRDQQIKPRWDRVLDDLRRARQDERAFESDVEALMEEGRRAGALPGWLREGIELEPEAPPEADRREPEPHGPIEPPVIEEGPP